MNFNHSLPQKNRELISNNLKTQKIAFLERNDNTQEFEANKILAVHESALAFTVITNVPSLFLYCLKSSIDFFVLSSDTCLSRVSPEVQSSVPDCLDVRVFFV